MRQQATLVARSYGSESRAAGSSSAGLSLHGAHCRRGGSITGQRPGCRGTRNWSRPADQRPNGRLSLCAGCRTWVKLRSLNIIPQVGFTPQLRTWPCTAQTDALPQADKTFPISAAALPNHIDHVSTWWSQTVSLSSSPAITTKRFWSVPFQFGKDLPSSHIGAAPICCNSPNKSGCTYADDLSVGPTIKVIACTRDFPSPSVEFRRSSPDGVPLIVKRATLRLRQIFLQETSTGYRESRCASFR